MRVRFLKSIASARWAYAPDEEADIPDSEAVPFIAGGICERCESPEPEAAVMPRARARRGYIGTGK